MDVIFSSHGLTKRYGENTVVNNVDMTVKRGDIYGFIGENGAGKTTIIRLVCGLAYPSGGSFELFGVSDRSAGILAARRRLAAIVEAPSIYTNMSARENIIEQCRILGIAPDRYEDLMRIVGLEDMISSRRKAGNFSLGMKQRLGIAMALAGSPEFVILDEPLNGLDPQGIVDMRALILKLNRTNGITFLISSHILRELSLVATKYGFISKGRLLAEITADELHARCRRSIDIETDNNTAAFKFIKESTGLAEAEIQGTEIRIYTETDAGELVSLLSGAGFQIKKINNREDSLEDYYLKITGGKKND